MKRGPYALVQARGLDDRIISRHATRDVAERALAKYDGDARYRVVDVGPNARTEAIEIFGVWTIRPRT